MKTGNIKATITKVLKNKNTLTILIIFVGIIGIYALYNWRVSEATKLVSIPYAKKEINSRTKITSDMVSYIQVPKSLLNDKDVEEFEYESRCKVFDNIPPLDDKKEKNIEINKLLYKMGFDKMVPGGLEKKTTKWFGIVKDE